MKNSFTARNSTYRLDDEPENNNGTKTNNCSGLGSKSPRISRSTGALDMLNRLSMSPKKTDSTDRKEKRRERREARQAAGRKSGLSGLGLGISTHSSTSRGGVNRSNSGCSTDGDDCHSPTSDGLPKKRSSSFQNLNRIFLEAQNPAKNVFEAAKASAKDMLLTLNKNQKVKFNTNSKRESLKKSKWEEGMEIIDQLLDRHSETSLYHMMTWDQRKKLASVKKLLLEMPKKQSGASNQAQALDHIPRGLARLNRKNKLKNRYDSHLNNGSSKMGHASTNATDGSNATERARLFKSDSTQDASCRFILQEYGGIDDPFLMDDLDMSAMDDRSHETHTRTDDTAGPAGSGTDDSSQASASSREGKKERRKAPATAATAKIEGKVPTAAPEAPVSKSLLKESTDAVVKKSTDPEPLVADNSNNNILQPDNYDFVPPEFTSLSNETQLQLTEVLAWESIQQWDFDVFELNRITNGHPLLFMGWAILGSSHAQRAMRKHVYTSLDSTTLKSLDDADNDGYGFVQEFQIPMDKLCNYMRVIESDYSTENAYHNAIHAADVMQTLHALIQQSNNNDNKQQLDDDAEESPTSPSLNVLQHSSKLHLFAILLSALVHDVDHNGKTNAFHVQVKSELAVLYNDKSVLENWHIAHAFSRLLNMDLKQQYLAIAATAAASATTSANSEANTNESKLEETIGESPNNFLCNVTTEQFMAIRKLMIEAVLNTDMIHHFQNVNAARGMLLEYKEQQEKDKEDEEEGSSPAAAAASAKKQEELSWKMLEYMMHLADISSQAKADPLFYQWTRRCLEEFFAQGDKEASLGLPISLLCDRATTSEPESQIGFIRFVVEPAFSVLGDAIPFVKDTVMNIIHNNLEHWTKEAEKEKAKAKLEKVASKATASKAAPDPQKDGSS